MFYGFTLYLKHNANADTSKFSDWLSFIRNIITNSTIENYQTFVSAKGLLDELAPSSNDIYAFLFGKTEKRIASNFAKEQMQDELQKAQIYHNAPMSKPILQTLENCNFCYGNMQFVFWCLDSTDTVSDIGLLSKLKKVFYEHLNDWDISDDFRRALFTIRDTKFYQYRSSWCSLLEEQKWCAVVDRDDLWRNYTRKDAREKDAKGQYLKDLLLKLCSKNLDEIIRAFRRPARMPDWKWRLIREADLLESCTSKYFTTDENDEHCYLLTVQRPRKEERCILVE
ncbi:hypothetical protein FACS1894200_12360 [Spirochaetia bacterium]|nr:hypothetical protein FACS1894200_12360 [Spirochaetia bacterium]